MDDESFTYFARRERSELAAVQAAKSSEARRIHEELAIRYAVLRDSSLDFKFVAEKADPSELQSGLRVLSES
jgi:hypothetical protein